MPLNMSEFLLFTDGNFSDEDYSKFRRTYGKSLSRCTYVCTVQYCAYGGKERRGKGRCFRRSFSPLAGLSAHLLKKHLGCLPKLFEEEDERGGKKEREGAAILRELPRGLCRLPLV